MLSHHFVVLLNCSGKSSVVDEGFHNGVIEWGVVGEEGHDEFGGNNSIRQLRG